jgi:hypothetical protein
MTPPRSSLRATKPTGAAIDVAALQQRRQIRLGQIRERLRQKRVSPCVLTVFPQAIREFSRRIGAAEAGVTGTGKTRCGDTDSFFAASAQWR